MDDIILRVKDICKYYPGVKALDGVNFEVKRGEVHAICGENGAGKSTFIKILTGANEPTSGTIEFNGKEYAKLTPKQSMELGISVIYQEFSLIPYLSVAENIFYGREIKKGIIRDIAAMEKQAKELCKEMGVDIDVHKRVCDLGIAYQQIVEILKAVSKKSEFIIMDEPTAPLTVKETAVFFKIIQKLKQDHVTIIFISHRLEEVFEICDRVSVFCDGKYIVSKDVQDITKKQLITYRDKENALNKRMAGEKLPRPAEAGDAFAEVILKACAFDREERYANAEEFREALERVKTGSSSAKTVHVRKTQELEHAPGKINPQKVQHKSQQRTPQKDRKQAIQQSQMKAETEGTVIVRKNNQERPLSAKKAKKRAKKKFEPLVAAVIIMFAAVCVIVGVFIWLLRENAELQRLKQSVTETVQTAESKQLQETLEKIQTQATEISDNLNDYSWIGSEEDGKISYLKQLDDGSWQVRKILIYPSLSKDNQYEEYYYWKNELFFAYIWSDSSTSGDIKEGQQKIDRYYYDDGKLVRWIDENNRCHDNETNNDEYVSRGEKYLNRAEEYKNELNLSSDSSSENSAS